MRFEKPKLLEQKVVYRGRIIDLVVDSVRINGKPTVREVVRHPGGVVILAEIEPDRIPFVRQLRYPMARTLLELPAGKIDGQENSAVSAARELEEETGYQPRSLHRVASFFSSPGFCDELLHLYYTNDTQETAPNREHDEQIALEFYSLSEALDLADRGEIEDAKTLVALLWLYRYKKQNGENASPGNNFHEEHEGSRRP